ncbi:MAG: type II toxin-antitoxin system HipA family toxin [Anaerolineaceae bacterium]|nr:type II toxin-antitoxin system HipA family toxin [Anaerolineaceae bacterium]
MSNAKITLWGTEIGAVSWLPDRELGVFQYHPDFLQSGIQLSPIMMPLNDFPYQFPHLSKETFRGLPGLLADSLPDKFGNRIINAWLASQGRNSTSFNPVERLCYIGTRGMGGLEFEPALLGPSLNSSEIDVAKLVELSNRILDQRTELAGVFSGQDDKEAMENILRVGTSAGGARAKAIIAWNPVTNSFRSGQIDLPTEYEHWIIKFDGISNNRDKEIADPQGFGKIEYAYSLMAKQVGILMSDCRLHDEGGRSHFMTKRFDRDQQGNKIHMQSLGAIAHADFNISGGYSYEELLQTMKKMGLPQQDLEQQILRTMFNIVARNQDDHVKNIGFLMDRNGIWRLSPAFDVTYANNPQGAWTSQHQMSLNGKRDDFTIDDMCAFAKIAGIKNPRAKEMLEQVVQCIIRWPAYAQEADVSDEHLRKIKNAHRLSVLM